MPSLRHVVGVFAHLVDWADYRIAGNTQPSTCPARLSFYTSSAPAAPKKEAA
jgi:hypothetical protein